MLDLDQRDVKYLPGVGPARAALLKGELQISTLHDLLYYLYYKGCCKLIAKNGPSFYPHTYKIAASSIKKRGGSISPPSLNLDWPCDLL
jgi:hypothetical protein